jgi:hypothetical protein
MVYEDRQWGRDILWLPDRIEPDSRPTAAPTIKEAHMN